MIPLPSLLLALGRAGIELERRPTDAEALHFRPFAALTPELADALRAHKGAVLAMLAAPLCAPRPEGTGAESDATDSGYVRAERLGVADDLGLRTHPGSSAWLIAVGESLTDASCNIRNSV
jgi:hypothetical protein